MINFYVEPLPSQPYKWTAYAPACEEPEPSNQPFPVLNSQCITRVVATGRDLVDILDGYKNLPRPTEPSPKAAVWTGDHASFIYENLALRHFYSDLRPTAL